MARTDDTTAFASNWRVVLAVDAGLGVMVVVIGVVVALLVDVTVGLTLVGVGAGYACLIGARARRWARLRRSGAR